MKTAIRLTALLSTLITIFLLGLLAASHFTQAPPPTAFLLILMVGLCANVWVNINDAERDIQIAHLKKPYQPDWFFQLGGIRKGHADLRGVVRDIVLERSNLGDAPFFTKLGAAASLPHLFTVIKYFDRGDDWDFEVFDTIDEAKAALSALESEAA